MLLENRKLLLTLLAVFALIEISLGRSLVLSGFDWRPLWGAPLVRGTMVDFAFTAAWCGLYLLDTARRQGRNGWAWIPLLLIFPTLAMFLFTLTSPRRSAKAATEAA